MGKAGEAVVPVLITVDPERDTPAQLADYVSRFHPRLIGLTGTPEQVAEAARRFRVYYAKARRPDTTDYLIDHSGFIYLVGPDSPGPHPVPAADLAGGDRRRGDRAACECGLHHQLIVYSRPIRMLFTASGVREGSVAPDTWS